MPYSQVGSSLFCQTVSDEEKKSFNGIDTWANELFDKVLKSVSWSLMELQALKM